MIDVMDITGSADRILNNPDEDECWICGNRIRTFGAYVLICRGCEESVGGTSLDERQAMRDAQHKPSAWANIMRKRSTPRIMAIPTPGAPERFAFAEAEGEVLTWAKRPSPCLLLLQGPTGTGKTWQAWGAVRALGHQAVGVKAASLSRIDHAGLSGLTGAKVLIIDDLASRTSPGALATALELIDYRLDDERLTIVTTNAGFPEITAIEPRIASRLASGRIVRLDGRDRRMPAKAAP